LEGIERTGHETCESGVDLEWPRLRGERRRTCDSPRVQTQTQLQVKQLQIIIDVKHVSFGRQGIVL
jgi:hypothetical protein